MLDTHCHIDETAFDADREAVVARQREAGVQAMIVPGVNVASVQTVLQVCHEHPHYCFPALGLHPEDVKDDWQQALETIETAIRTHRSELVAIGEIGLDYYWDKTYKEQQQEVLRRQLLLARELDLPVILHNREATEDIVRIVREISNLQSPIVNYQLSTINYQLSPLRGVFHCFNGSRETAQQILEMGFYLGIGGVLTFKNCKLADTLAELNNGLQSSINRTSSIVQSSILLETDAPYMAPVPHRGERNESRFMAHVAERLAQVFQTTPEAIIAQTTTNARRLFNRLDV
jgi:TatD DNase family protein